MLVGVMAAVVVCWWVVCSSFEVVSSVSVTVGAVERSTRMDEEEDEAELDSRLVFPIDNDDDDFPVV